MRKTLIVAALALLAIADATQARTLEATSNIIVRAFGRSIDFTSDTTTSIRDSKIVMAAKEDAASYVASGGEYRGVQLEAALQTLRADLPQARQADDQQLAEAILAL
ncbi:DUF2388 domain-containing protein [Pseudomonas typographi]|uniref:DUF2388 domain-containing protein n=1 Tax=Pseudomonas typographi TaxID=2715964 RepID=A0ABR7Z4E2_9PSED|nr:DUF2388 domain-containing protein [Pseudomonas typographi]MBD1552981.1 DUF2388 domain-containing protein [Pseudomonas typographi]MBD1600327.1 DUF2388 domain-containing protein [Pseudomonas typographi]